MTSPATPKGAPDGQSGPTGNLRHAIDETRQSLQSAVANGHQTVDAMTERLEARVAQMRERLAESEGAMLDNARHGARAANQSVHEHPYRAIGIAAVVGCLVGFVAARR